MVMTLEYPLALAEGLPEAIADNPVALGVQQRQEPINMLGPETPKSVRFREVVAVTPMLDVEPGLVPGAEGYDIVVKYEGAQPSKSYKLGGATNALHRALDRAADAGTPIHTAVVASTGNHGNSVAVAGGRVEGLEVKVLCPAGTSPAKLKAMEANGAIVDNSYKTLPEALRAAETQGNEDGFVYIDPFNNLDTIAGQGRIAHEVIADLRARQARGEIDLERDEIVLFVPGGGGGCAAGNAVAVAANCPNIRVVVSQMRGCEGIVKALHGEQLNPATVDTSCDGAAVAVPGELPMAILRDGRLVDSVRLVEKHQVGEAMRLLSQVHETPEPAGALAFAAMLQYAREYPVDPQDGRRDVLIPVTSGINVTPQKIAEFCQAEFAEFSNGYSRRITYGMEEVLDRPMDEAAVVAGAILRVVSGPTAYL